MKNLFFIISVLLIIGCTVTPNLSNIDEPIENDMKENSYQWAFDEIVEKLYNIHPCFTQNDYKYFDKTTFNRIAFEIFYELYRIETLKSINDKDFTFYYIVSKFISKINDGHISLSLPLNGKEQRLPIDLKWFDDKLYVVSSSKDYSGLMYKEVSKIGKIKVKTIQKKVDEFIPADNINGKTLINGDYLSRKTVLMLLGLIRVDNNVDIEYKDNGIDKEITLPFTYENIPQSLSIGRNNITKVNPYDVISIYISNDCNIIYVQLNNFYDFQVDSYFLTDLRSYFDSLFNMIKQLKIKNLIIDLRNNAGGMPEIAYQLLSYIKSDKQKSLSTFFMLVKPSKYLDGWKYNEYLNLNLSNKDKSELYYITSKNKYALFNTLGIIDLPQTYIFSEPVLGVKKDNENSFSYSMDYPKNSQQFDGNLYVFIGNKTFSMASWFAAIVKDNGLGTLIGEPTGGSSISHTSGIPIKLKDVSFTIYISPILTVRASQEALENEHDAILPDIFIPTTIEDYKNNVDPLWDYLMNKIFRK